MLTVLKAAAVLIGCSALAQPSCADSSRDVPAWQGMLPVSKAALERLRASGRLSDIRHPQFDTAVILWDEPKTPRPGGNKLGSAGAVVAPVILNLHIIGTAP